MSLHRGGHNVNDKALCTVQQQNYELQPHKTFL